MSGIDVKYLGLILKLGLGIQGDGKGQMSGMCMRMFVAVAPRPAEVPLVLGTSLLYVPSEWLDGLRPRLRRPSARRSWRELLAPGRPGFFARLAALSPAPRHSPPRDALSQRALPARAPEPPRAATLNLRARMRPRPAPILLILHLAGTVVAKTRGRSKARAPSLQLFSRRIRAVF